MKSVILSFTALVLFSLNSYAEEIDCSGAAVRKAKEGSRTATRVYEVIELDSGKSYLEKYYVVLVDSYKKPRVRRASTITLMKSDCSVTSVVPEL
ncbi:MAG: hypothetical protein AABZ31_07580 [Bdellovibrionota bacterium]